MELTLRDLVAKGREELKRGGKQYSKSDLDFHIAVANSSHNNLLPRLLLDIRGLLVGSWIRKSQELPGVRENAQQQHEAILEAIVLGDSERARNEMRAHLTTFEKAYTLLGQDIGIEQRASRVNSTASPPRLRPDENNSREQFHGQLLTMRLVQITRERRSQGWPR